MSSAFRLWKGGTAIEVVVDGDTPPPRQVAQLVSVEDQLFFVDGHKRLWRGRLEQERRCCLVKTNVVVLDLAVFGDRLLYVNEFGRVFEVSGSLEKPAEVVLHDCVHRYATSIHQTFVRKIAASPSGVLFVSECGELWASGSHPQLGIDSLRPRKVTFFEGRLVVALDSGDNFCVIVTHKKDEVCPMVNGKATNGGEVFLSTCRQCSNSEAALTPLTPQSLSDVGPPALQFKQSTESLSASSSTSRDVRNKGESNENSSSCSEDDSPRRTDTSECSVANFLPEDQAEYEKAARASGNMLHINTETARQFLTRQLSWVSSGGEELLAEVTGPSRIIRMNMSTVASLVYVGVKTVGDKVATLSRHVSGGSDLNSESFEEFEELNESNASTMSGCSGDLSEEVAAERNKSCLSLGSRLMRGEVWSWGSSVAGQLGSGDTANRTKPILVGSVTHIGVTGVWCGQSHCLVQTLDGRVFGWGSNASRQLSDDRHVQVVSFPLLLAKALSAAAGAAHSVMLVRTRPSSLLWLSSSKNSPDGEDQLGRRDDLSASQQDLPSHVLCSGEFTCLVSRLQAPEATLESDLAHEQCFLEELVTVHSSLVKPLTRKSSLDDTFSNLCSRYVDVLHMSAVVVAALLEGRPSHEVLTHHQDDLIYVYEAYMNTFFDVIAINGFAQVVKSVDIPSKIVACFSDRLPSRKTSPESIVACAFAQPLSHIAVYKGMLSRGGQVGCMEKLVETQESRRKEAELTKLFWEGVGNRLPEALKTPQRRFVKESRSISVNNSSRFSSHWIILMSDILIHFANNSHQSHSLSTIWVDSASLDSDTNPNSLSLTLPEDSLILVTSSPNERTEWLHAIQNAIKSHLNKSAAPVARTASHLFVKSPYKDAKYNGRWSLGKMEGWGKMEWADGRVYTGQFHNGQCHGSGRYEVPGLSVYEGQWRDGVQNGHGVTKYKNGDVYCGYYKDGLECGHGMRKNGRFTSGQASIYVGEWLLGQQHGYGVLNNLSTGEKYLGLWSGNLRSGPGLTVTLDGIYYEGTFSQGNLTGRGVMVLDDGTHYDGELREAGVFSGKGTLTFSTGDTFEGTLHGTWTEGIKINGTLQKHLDPAPLRRSFSRPGSFGLFSVGADAKWKSIFRQCSLALGISGEAKAGDTAKAWENVAALLANCRGTRHHELLEVIAHFGRTNLDLASYRQVVSYLQQAFDSVHHPLGRAFAELVEAYTTTYGGALVHPLLLPQAVAELRSITARLYAIVSVFFPALPPPTSDLVLSSDDNDDDKKEVVTMCGLLHPIILPKLYSSLLVLYSLHNRSQNDTYWKRLLKWNRHPDSTLLAFLGVDKKFWQERSGDSGSTGQCLFADAVINLQQLKTTFSPTEKLIVIHSTFKAITQAVHIKLGDTFVWQMDDLFPVFHYVVVRSHIQELASEIHFIDDFIEDRFKNGEMDIMFTTLKACYFQILQEKIAVAY